MSYYTDRSLPVLDVPVTLDSSQTFASAPWLENSSCGPWTDDVDMQVTKLRRPPSSNDRGFRGFLDFRCRIYYTASRREFMGTVLDGGL